MGKVCVNDVLIALKQVKLVNQVTICVAEVCNILETLSGSMITDWKCVGDIYYRKMLGLQADTSPQGTAGYFLVLHNFVDDSLTGCGQYSDVYKVKTVFCT